MTWKRQYTNSQYQIRSLLANGSEVVWQKEIGNSNTITVKCRSKRKYTRIDLPYPVTYDD